MIDVPANRRRGVRKVLSTKDEWRVAVSEIAGLANRTISIFTHDLEPEVYDHDLFLEAVKRFVLSRTFTRVRVLIAEPTRAIKTGNRFVTMGRRLTSYIEFRHVREEFREGRPEAYCIADDFAIAYRANAERWEGVSDTFEPPVARKYLTAFDEIWAQCEYEPELRRLHL